MDPGYVFNEYQKQGTTSKDEKAGKPVAADQKQAIPTKMEPVAEIYKRMRAVKDVIRRDVIETCITEVKLTNAGATTYYQTIKDQHEPRSKK
ncbi:hypothetical protein LGN30_01900 [Burkholderia seminalis]|uniref:hypothetical protein n=1 Tax=Burkholderia seminalis TaxID=488731 RepID=UPI001CF552CC|nr:hypothetical protein [Burkholderia seminalis]MCA8421937.1 hypothetical protein [Burkholderia seminalis]